MKNSNEMLVIMGKVAHKAAVLRPYSVDINAQRYGRQARVTFYCQNTATKKLVLEHIIGRELIATDWQDERYNVEASKDQITFRYRLS